MKPERAITMNENMKLKGMILAKSYRIEGSKGMEVAIKKVSLAYNILMLDRYMATLRMISAIITNSKKEPANEA